MAPTRPDSSELAARHVVVRMVLLRSARWGLLWGLVFGAYIAESAIGFKTVAGTPAARAKLAHTLGTNKGMAALFGPARHIDTIGGFTAWRSLGFLMLLGGVIGFLLSTSALRGEEEAGRWEVLLAGRTTRGGAAGQALAGLGAGVVVLFLITAAIAVAGGHESRPRIASSGMLSLALVSASTVAVFVAVGALASQLSATRRQSATLSAVAFGASLLVRAAADTVSGLHWARWATPLGWPSLFHALTGTRWVALLPSVVSILVLGVATVATAGRRDLGAASLPRRDSARSHVLLLSGHEGLALRLGRSSAIAWISGLAVTGGFLGLIAQSASESVSGSNAVQEALARLGAHRSGSESYLGLAFLMVVALVAFAGATVVVATREEEADGRLDNLIARPVGRPSWLVARVGVAAGLALVCGVVAGIAAWAGAATQNTGIGFGTMLAAGFNAVPPAFLLIGVGTLAFGVVPRWTAVSVYTVLGWSFLIEMLGSAVRLNHWLLDTSIFHQVSPAPATNPNWASAGVLIGVGVLVAGAGVLFFDRRDLVSV